MFSVVSTPIAGTNASFSRVLRGLRPAHKSPDPSTQMFSLEISIARVTTTKTFFKNAWLIGECIHVSLPKIALPNVKNELCNCHVCPTLVSSY